jgi:hydroxymethylpyrimidine pyrophosphatase-like HAD family hydrolase
MKVPDYVAQAARRGLEWHAEGKSGDGVTDGTIAEARAMAGGNVSEDKLRRMNPWFQRHRSDMDAPKNKPSNEGFPGAGAVAWALWGGPTSGDIMRTAKWAEAEVNRLDQESQAKTLNQNLFNLTKKSQITMPEILVSDIDGTVLDNNQPIQEVIDYIKEEGYPVYFLTNRQESDRQKTIEDLKAKGLTYRRLIMNSGNDSAPVFKKAEMQKLLDEGFDPQEFIDDSKENRDAVGSLGVETVDPADIIAEAQMQDSVEDSGEDSAEVANNNKFMTIEEQLVKASDEISAVVTERDEIRVAMEALVAKEQTELKELSAKVGELSGALEKVTAENAELLNKIAELQKNQISASAEAAKIASSVGVDPVEISPADAPKKAVSHLEAFLSMPAGAERSAYYAKFKNEIVRGL